MYHERVSKALESVVMINVTPFDSKGGVDSEAYASVLARCVDAGVDAVTPNGNTSEFYSLSGEEIAAAVRATVAAVGDRMRHFRGSTIHEVEGQLLAKLVMNSAQGHFNEDIMSRTPFGQRIVFGLITASTVIGLATQDTAEDAIAELGLDRIQIGRAHV